MQEYFTTRSICEGRRLKGSPPWQWSVWWMNVLQIGSQMDEFSYGLQRACGILEKQLKNLRIAFVYCSTPLMICVEPSHSFELPFRQD